MVEEGIFKLRKVLAELGKIKGRHTELVSVYVPAGASLTDSINQLKNEQGTAENIKSKATRKNVVGALEKAVQHLKLYKKTPENGLALFSGNVSEQEGVTDIKIWAIEPPEKLEIKLYWCDQVFRLEPLQEMVAEREIYGLAVMDNQEAAIGLLRGKKIILLRKMDSIVPGKTAKGGQSAARFERVREGLINDWYKQIAGTMKNSFGPEVKGILFGGPGPAKDDFLRGDYLQTDIRKKIIATSSTSYSDQGGLEELIERTKEALAEAAVAKERALVQKFLEHLQRSTGLAVYGPKQVLSALETGAVDIIIVSEKFDLVEVELEDKQGHEDKRFVKAEEASNQICAQCSQKMGVLGQMDTFDALKERASQYGTHVEVISKDTREGEQLVALGGIGALLRYRLQ